MTLQQLRLAIQIAAMGSISAAASKLEISQPNASLSLKKLEAELGYEIFNRSEGCVTPTENGYRFLDHASNILKEDEEIRSLVGIGVKPRLRLGTMNYTPAVDAFVEYCRENRDAADADLICINVSTSAAVSCLKNKTLDVIVSLQIKPTLPAIEKICKDNKFDIIKWRKIPICVRLRKDHPLIMSGEMDGSVGGFKKLGKYPCVDYMDMEHLHSLFTPFEGAGFPRSYPIRTDERDNRLRLVGETNAYVVGCAISKEKLDFYGLEQFLINDETATLVTVTRKGDHNLPGVSRYFEILEEILKKQYE